MVKEFVAPHWKTLTALACGIGIGALAAVQAQQKPTLSPQDYMEIQQLVNRYAYALDGGLGKGTGYADLFTSDGVFINESGRHEGRQELMRLGGATRAEESPNNISHVLTNHIIEPGPNGGAIGKQYLQVLAVTPPAPGTKFEPGITILPVAHRIAGHYEDIYQKTPQGWRFKQRHVIFAVPRTPSAPAPAASAPR